MELLITQNVVVRLNIMFAPGVLNITALTWLILFSYIYLVLEICNMF